MIPTDRKEQIKTLWRQCFEDPDHFVEFYFDRVYKEENTLSLEEDGRIVSALQMIPYAMTWCGVEIIVAYISGTCTAPDKRGQGLMGQLLHKSFSEMHKRDFDITALIPASASLFEFYRNYDYTEAFDYSLRSFDCPCIPAELKDTPFLSLDKEPGEQWFGYFDRKLRERPSCLLHSSDDFKNNITDTLMDHGLVLGMLDAKGHPVGLAFVTATENEAFIKEMFSDSDEVKQNLLFKAADSFGVNKVLYKTPPDRHNSNRYGMARVLNKDKMIWQWLDFHPDTQLSAEELNRMDTQALTRNLLGYGQKDSYMSLMLD